MRTGSDDPERGRRQDDRDQERRADEAAASRREPDAEREREREREPGERQSQQRAAQPVEVDLEPGEQEQEREPDEREHADRLVVVRPAEHRRADDDPGDELEHDRGKPHSGDEPEQERRAERDRRDDRDRVEGDVHPLQTIEEGRRYGQAPQRSTTRGRREAAHGSYGWAMNSTALVLVFALGSGVLAMWVEARFGRFTPESMRARFFHLALALAFVQLSVPVMQLVVGEGASVSRAVFGLVYVFLPALVYSSLTSIWLLKLVAEGRRPA